MGLNHSPRIVTDGLVLCLDAANKKSYPGSGTTWNDLSGNNNNGTLTNGPTFNSVNLGSLVFDGVNDYFVTSQNDNNAITNGITMSLWTKFTTRGVLVPLSKGLKTTGHYEIWFNNGIFNCYFFDLGTGSYQNSTVAVNNGNWNFLVVTYDNANVRFYRNGINIRTNAISTTSIPTMNATIDIGRSAQDGLYFSGNIAQASIYNRALSAAEIQQNFNAIRGRFGI
jgi:hypothetical protein